MILDKLILPFFLVLGLLIPFSGVFSVTIKVLFSLSIVIFSLILSLKQKKSLFFVGFISLILAHYFINYSFLYLSSSSFFQYINSSIELLCFLILLTPIFNDKKSKFFFFLGVLISLSLLSVVFILNHFEILLLPIFHSNPYWELLGRKALNFNDPNEYGVFVALLMPYIFYGIFYEFKESSLKWLLLVCSLFILFCVIFSGSRTLAIGVFVTLISILIIEKRLKTLLIFSVFILASIFLISNTNLCSNYTPKSLNRVCSSLNYKKIGNTLYSRSVFSKLNISIFKSNPIVGVGYNSFERELPYYKKKLNINIDNWVDNPNSFYLGILSELGLLGLLIFFLDLSYLRFKKEENQDFYFLAGRIALISFVVMLFTGPHINYLSVAFLLNFIISSTLIKKSYGKKFFLISLILIILSFYFYSKKVKLREFGLYAYEKNEIGNFQWTAKNFAKKFDCLENKFIRIKFRAASPDISNNPIKATFFVGDKIKEVRLDSYQVKELNFRCENDLVVNGSLDKTFSPANDLRVLGIQVFG